MIKYSNVKLIYTCPACVPENIYLNRSYTIGKDEKGFYFTDGNYIEHAEEWYIKMLFSPQGKDITWESVDFTEEAIIKKK